MKETLLEMSHIGKRFRVFQVQKTLFRLSRSIIQGIPFKRDLWVLKDINVQIRAGEKIGLIGRNGAGKTTLLRVACGIYVPTEGTIKRIQPLRPLFIYGMGLNYELPVIDNIYILGAFYGILASEIRLMCDEIIRFSELEELLYVPVKKLSTGQVQRLLFSVFMQTRDPFLAFDESTSLADIPFNKKVAAYFHRLMNSDRTVILASHALDVIQEYCQRVIWLEHGKIRRIGPVKKVCEEYLRFCDEGNF